jgi:membrane associated rhomboid family serine protease
MIYVYGFNQSAKSLVGIMISSIILGSVAIEIFTDPQDTHTGFSHIIFGLVGANIIFGIRQFPTNLGWLIISGILFYEKYNLCIGTPDIVRSHISWYGHSAGMIGGMLFAAYKSLKNGRSDYVEIVATPLYLFQSSCPKRQGV